MLCPAWSGTGNVRNNKKSISRRLVREIMARLVPWDILCLSHLPQTRPAPDLSGVCCALLSGATRRGGRAGVEERREPRKVQMRAAPTSGGAAHTGREQVGRRSG